MKSIKALLQTKKELPVMCTITAVAVVISLSLCGFITKDDAIAGLAVIAIATIAFHATKFITNKMSR